MLAWAQDEQMSLNIRESALRVLGHAEELEADVLTRLAELAQIGSYRSDLGHLSVTIESNSDTRCQKPKRARDPARVKCYRALRIQDCR